LDLFKFYVEELKARFHDEKKIIKDILKVRETWGYTWIDWVEATFPEPGLHKSCFPGTWQLALGIQIDTFSSKM
jgi:hypothetical protein